MNEEVALDYILVRDADSGADTEVTTVTLTTGKSLTVYAAGYDADNTYISDVPVNW